MHDDCHDRGLQCAWLAFPVMLLSCSSACAINTIAIDGNGGAGTVLATGGGNVAPTLVLTDVLIQNVTGMQIVGRVSIEHNLDLVDFPPPQMVNLDGPGDATRFFNSVEIQSVPEPGSMTVLSVSMVVLLRRRRGGAQATRAVRQDATASRAWS